MNKEDSRLTSHDLQNIYSGDIGQVSCFDMGMAYGMDLVQVWPEAQVDAS